MLSWRQKSCNMFKRCSDLCEDLGLKHDDSIKGLGSQ